MKYKICVLVPIVLALTACSKQTEQYIPQINTEQNIYEEDSKDTDSINVNKNIESEDQRISLVIWK